MILIRRSIPFLAGIGLVLGMEILVRQPNDYGWWIAVVDCWLLLCILLVEGKRFRSRQTPLFLFSPMILVTSAGVLFLFIDVPVAIHAIIVILGILVISMLTTLFNWLEAPLRYQPYALENIITYMNLISIFFCGIGAFSAVVFLAWSRWLTIPVLAVIGGLLALMTFWVHKLPIRQSWRALIVCTAVFGEIATALAVLPTGFFVNGGLFAAGFYFIVNISRHAMLEDIDRAVWRRYIIVTGTMVLLILATANWR